jgi:hypothetical protein
MHVERRGEQWLPDPAATLAEMSSVEGSMKSSVRPVVPVETPSKSRTVTVRTAITGFTRL